MIALLLLACTIFQPKDELLDPDGDGVGWPDDCDDTDDDVSPSLPEVCDGKDNNCDGEVDENGGSVAWTEDTDHDGYGSDATDAARIMGCVNPVGYGPPTDCDDTNDAIHPDADETCQDSADNNCDGVVNEPTATDAQTWYPDNDGDGHGDDANATAACEAPPDHVETGGDCDDDRDDIHPDADERCDELDNNCDGQTDEDSAVDAVLVYDDADRDGYGDPASAATRCDPTGHTDDDQDCDDGDPDVHPGADERCDDQDDDCDGAVDEDATDAPTWYADGDGDGDGDDDAPTVACDPPDGAADVGGDCDDADPEVHTRADEVCDGQDNNCDGDVDEPTATDALDWYLDGDGDGYGDASRSTRGCDQPEGYAAPDDDALDCDDDDATVHPDATDTCDDGVDSDCSGAATPCGRDVSDHGLALLGASANGGLGAALDAADLDGDGDLDLAIGAPEDDAVDTNVGAVYLVPGPFSAGSADVALTTAGGVATTEILGEPLGEETGASLSARADLDGDGWPDLAIGAPKLWLATTSQKERGGVYLLFGPVASGSIDLETDRDLRVVGTHNYERVGYSLLPGGDLDGDGADDLVLGAFGHRGGSSGAYVDNIGAINAFYGPLSGASGDVVVSAADLTITGVEAEEHLGTSLASGDLDGDGIVELLAGNQNDNAAGTLAGAVHLIQDPGPGSYTISDVAVTISGASADDLLGAAVTTCADLDGDGYGELILGGPSADVDGAETGAVYLVPGGVALTGGDVSTLATATVTGDADGDALSRDAACGDHNGDGQDDLLIASPGYDHTENAGAAWLYLSPPLGAMGTDDADVALWGEGTYDGLGRPLALPGDLDGTPGADALLGAITDSTVYSQAGAVYMVFQIGL